MEFPTTFIIAVAVTNGLMEVIKRTDVEEKFSRFYPLATLVVGFLIAFFIVGLLPLTSIIVPLTAMGLYSGVKATLK